MRRSEYYIYIMTNKRNGVLYTGVTNNLKRRVEEHKTIRGSYFTTKYKLKLLVYYEIYSDPINAIQREKQIKAGSRQKKITLIETMNPQWTDIYPHL